MFDKSDLGKMQGLLYSGQMTRIAQQTEQMGQHFSACLQSIEESLRDELIVMASVQ